MPFENLQGQSGVVYIQGRYILEISHSQSKQSNQVKQKFNFEVNVILRLKMVYENLLSKQLNKIRCMMIDGCRGEHTFLIFLFISLLGELLQIRSGLQNQSLSFLS